MTVNDLIAMLKQHDGNRTVGLRDPDTGWWAPIIHARSEGERVAITAEYHEMTSKE